MRLLHLYRPRLPGCRAQAVQVLHSCHALAARGHQVTLLADRGPAPATPARVLADFGLDALPNLDLRISPWAHSGLAGRWFRRQLSAWWAGPPGLLLVRDQRRLLQALGQLGAGRHGGAAGEPRAGLGPGGGGRGAIQRRPGTSPAPWLRQRCWWPIAGHPRGLAGGRPRRARAGRRAAQRHRGASPARFGAGSWPALRGQPA